MWECHQLWVLLEVTEKLSSLLKLEDFEEVVLLQKLKLVKFKALIQVGPLVTQV